MLQNLLLIPHRFNPNFHSFLNPLLPQLMLLRDARKLLGTHIINKVTRLVQCNYFLFLPFLLNLLLLNFVFKHLLCSGARFLNLFDCLFLLGLQETDAVIQLFGMQLFLLLQFSSLGYRADAKHA